MFSDGTVKCIEDEIPFAVPNGWNWCRLKALAAPIENAFVDGPFGSNLKTDHYTENREVRIIQLNNIGDLEWKDNGKKYTTYEHAETLERCKTYSGDIVIAKMMPAGRAIIVPDNENIYVISSDCVRLRLPNYINNFFVMCAINSSIVNKQVLENVQGIGRTRTSLGKMKEVLIPLPAYHEQSAITNILKDQLGNIDDMDLDIEDLKTLIVLSKEKILDLAIKGKLVAQDPNDEPASALLNRIRAEKEKLIKQGKLKGDKKESIIYKGDDNSYYEKLSDGSTNCIDKDLPFDIPCSWRWERLRNLFVVNPKNNVDDEIHVSFIPMALLDDGYSGEYAFEEKAWKECKKGFTHFADGDVCFAKISPCFENRKSAFFQDLCNGYGAGTTELYVLRRYTDDIMPEYLLAFVKSEYFISRGRNTFSGVVGQQRVDKEVMLDTFIPIPPITEQNRINNTLKIAFSQISYIEDGIN